MGLAGAADSDYLSSAASLESKKDDDDSRWRGRGARGKKTKTKRRQHEGPGLGKRKVRIPRTRWMSEVWMPIADGGAL